MSADNGVYVLHDMFTDTWRVAHVQAIDNFGWWHDEYSKAWVDNGDTTPYTEPWNGGTTYVSARDGFETYVRSVWGGSDVFKTEETAMVKAVMIYRSLDICEYGISFVELPIRVEWSK